MRPLKASELKLGTEVMLSPEALKTKYEGFTLRAGAHNPLDVKGEVTYLHSRQIEICWANGEIAQYPLKDGVFLSPSQEQETPKESDFDNLSFGTRITVKQEIRGQEVGTNGIVIATHDSDHDVRIAFEGGDSYYIDEEEFNRSLAIAEGKKSFPHKYATRIASDQSPDGLILIADSIEALESTFQDLHPGHHGLDPTKIKRAVVEGDRATQTLEVKYREPGDREPGEKCATEVRNGMTQRDEAGEICSPIEPPVTHAASLFTDLGNLPLIPLHRK